MNDKNVFSVLGFQSFLILASLSRVCECVYVLEGSVGGWRHTKNTAL